MTNNKSCNSCPKNKCEVGVGCIKPRICSQCNFDINVCQCSKIDLCKGKKGRKGERGPKGPRGCKGEDGTKIELICINYQGLSGCCLKADPTKDQEYFLKTESCQLFENKNGHWVLITPKCENYYFYDIGECVIYHIKWKTCYKLCAQDKDLALDCCNNVIYIYHGGCWTKKCTLCTQSISHVTHIPTGIKTVTIAPPSYLMTNKIQNMEIVNNGNLPPYSSVIYEEGVLKIVFDEPLCLSTPPPFQFPQFDFVYKIEYESICCLTSDLVYETIICDKNDYYHNTIINSQLTNMISFNLPQGIIVDPSVDTLSFCESIPGFEIQWDNGKVKIITENPPITSMDFCYLVTKENGDIIRVYESIHVIIFFN